MMGGLLPRLLAWSADAKLGVAMRRERQVRAITRMVGPGLVVMGASAHAVPRGRASVRSANVHSTRGVRCGGSTPRASRSWCSRRTSMGGSRTRTGRRSRRCALSPSLSSSQRHRVIGVFGRRACAGMRASHAHAKPFTFLIWQVRAHVKEQQRAESETPGKHALLTPRSSDAANRCAPHAMHHETAPRARRVAYLAPYISAISRPYIRAGRDHRSVRAARRAFLRPRAAEAQLGALFSTHPR